MKPPVNPWLSAEAPRRSVDAPGTRDDVWRMKALLWLATLVLAGCGLGYENVGCYERRLAECRGGDVIDSLADDAVCHHDATRACGLTVEEPEPTCRQACVDACPTRCSEPEPACWVMAYTGSDDEGWRPFLRAGTFLMEARGEGGGVDFHYAYGQCRLLTPDPDSCSVECGTTADVFCNRPCEALCDLICEPHPTVPDEG